MRMMELLFVNVIVCVDVQWLYQVLINLMENSVCYIVCGGCVGLLMELLDEYCCIVFDDSVLGVVDEILVWFGECFFCFDVLCCCEDGGVGLGLVLSCKLIELQGGELIFGYFVLGGVWVMVILLWEV